VVERRRSEEARVTPAVAERLRAIVGDEGFVSDAAGTRVYECDGFTLARAVPQIVVLPKTAEEAVEVVRLLASEKVAFVPRGAGTGLSGGCLPLDAAVMVGTSRMRSIRAVDWENRRVVVEAGVVNLHVTRAAAPHGLHYAPDPSSQSACTIGGNVAENSGGPHTLKYGVTTNHVLGVEIVLPNGELIEIGGAIDDVPGYDLRGLAIGAEGTFGLVTAATLRLVRTPEAVRTLLAVFDDVDAACRAVSAIIAAGVLPAALELMDRAIVAAVETAYGFGFPADAGAVLIIEVDGIEAGIADQVEAARALCGAAGATEVRVARDDQERAALWKSRKRAFGAVGRLAPNYCTQDGVVPRGSVPEILRRIAAIAQRRRLRIANVFHAGDGNIHPIILFDERDRDEVERVLEAGREILEACVELGGSVTGEHGIGVEKIAQMPLLFSPVDLRVMQELRQVFDPDQRCNPGKIFPTPGACVEVNTPRRQVPL
jgi:glycolate oxidase